jgi:flavorubredoxin
MNVLEVLGSVLDPADVRWIWLTHPVRDHKGGICDLLAAAGWPSTVSSISATTLTCP